MRSLKNILKGVEVLELIGDDSVLINNLQFDSRIVEQNDMFIAVDGTQVDGHKFIDSCIEKGASVIVCQKIPANIQTDTTYIKVADSSQALGILASNFFDNPSAKLKLVGITGTNGKTSTVTMLFNLFRDLGYHVGLLSTVSNKIDDRVIKSTHTTPDAIQLNELLLEMVDVGCEYCWKLVLMQ